VLAAKPPSPLQRDTLNLFSSIWRLGEAEQSMLSQIASWRANNPRAGSFTSQMMVQYAQIRHMYQSGNFWESRPDLTPRVRSSGVIPLASLHRRAG
jgi:hypothetical protein